MKIFKTFMLFLVFSILALALGEWAVRKICYSKFGEKICFFDFPGFGAGKEYWIQGLNPYFGVWHLPHAHFRLVKSCFDVWYSTNAYGARDRERMQHFQNPSESKLKNRVLILGDSWIEGLGVNQDFTISELLERKSATEHLNFGIGGNNSPLQYLLRYMHLANQFDHEVVIVGLLPFNDFDEMNIEVGKFLYPQNYRPYLVGDYPHPQIQYFYNPSDGKPSWSDRFWDWISSRSYLYRFYDFIKHQREAAHKTALARSGDGLNSLYENFSRYRSFSEKEFLGLQWVLERFLEVAKNKKLVILTFPALQDFKIYEKESGEHTPLSDRLSHFIEELHNPNVFYIDLLPLMKKNNSNPESFFLMCDGHMSPYGNQVASELVYQQLKGKIY